MTTDLAPRPLDSRALENSEQEFITRYVTFAAQGTLYPQVEGSPLMEFSAGGRVLFLFDRMGPYAVSSGPARVIVHGQVNAADFQVLPVDSEQDEVLNSTAISAVEGKGQVLLAGRRSCVVQARLPLVLSVLDGMTGVSVGDWVRFATQPPLHGFLVK